MVLGEVLSAFSLSTLMLSIKGLKTCWQVLPLQSPHCAHMGRVRVWTALLAKPSFFLVFYEQNFTNAPLNAHVLEWPFTLAMFLEPIASASPWKLAQGRGVGTFHGNLAQSLCPDKAPLRKGSMGKHRMELSCPILASLHVPGVPVNQSFLFSTLPPSMCTGAHVCACVWGPEADLQCSSDFIRFFSSFLDIKSLNGCGPVIQLDRLAHGSQGSSCLYLLRSAITIMCHHKWLFC